MLLPYVNNTIQNIMIHTTRRVKDDDRSVLMTQKAKKKYRHFGMANWGGFERFSFDNHMYIPKKNIYIC